MAEKAIITIDIDGKKAIATIDELNKTIKEQTKLLNSAQHGSEEYTKTAKTLDKLKVAHKGVTAELKKEDKERTKLQKATQKESAQRRKLIEASRLEGKTNDELRRKLNAMINLRDKYTARGSKAYNKLTTSVQKLDKEVKKNNATVGRHQGNVGNYPKVMAGAVAAAGALIMAFRMVSKAAKQSIDAFLVQEDIGLKVSNTFGDFSNQINNAADATQNLTRVGNEQYQKLAILASNMGVANGEVNQTVQDSIGLAELFAASGLSQETAMKGLALARQGDYTQLQRYIPALKQATTEAEKQAILNDITAKGFDMAKKNVESYQGRITQMKNAYGDLQEVVGGQVLGGLFDPKDGGAIIDNINKVIDALEETQFITTMMDAWAKPAKKFGDLIQSIASIFGETADAGDVMTTIFNVLIKTFEFATLPIQIVIGYLQNAIDTAVGVYNIFANIKDAEVGDIFDLIKKSISGMIAPLTDFLGLTDELNSLLGQTSSEIAKVSEQTEKFGTAFGDLKAEYQDFKVEVEALAIEENNLQAEMDALNATTDAQTAAIKKAQKAYDDLTLAIFNANEQYEFSSFFAETRLEQWEAEKKKINDLIAAQQKYLEQDGWTQEELERFKAYKDELMTELNVVKDELFAFNDEVNAILKESPLQILPDTEELEKQVEASEKAINDMMNKRVAANDVDDKERDKKRDEETKKNIQDWNNKAKAAEDFAGVLQGIVTNSIDETGFSLQKFGQGLSLFILDILEKQVTASVVSAAAQSFAQPDSVATAGASGAIRAGILAGLIKGAFTVVKSVISKPSGGFAEGGYTGDGGKYEAAGTVHKGEVVFSQSDVAQLGGATAVDNMRPTKQQYFTGGIVGIGNVADPSASQNNQLMEAMKLFKPVVTVEDINAVASSEANRQQVSVV